MLNVITASSKLGDINILISLGQELSLAILLDKAYQDGIVTWLKFLGVTMRSECKIIIRKAWWLFSPHSLSNCSIHFSQAFQPFSIWQILMAFPEL